MAASQTVPQLAPALNVPQDGLRRLAPVRGVVTLFGHGITVRVERGHLIVQDGIGVIRRAARFPRVSHGLRRLVVVGSDGMVSLAAIRWLADQKAAFVMLDRDGSVLVATGPVGTRDARLRRAQALALYSGDAVPLVRDLIDRKLVEQERVTRDVLGDTGAAQAIALARAQLPFANSTDGIRLQEAQAAMAYWASWRALPVLFPKTDLPRVPAHWRTFGTRHSPLTGSPRLSVNPPNAMLNYVYAVLESEARLAATALGLDPGLGLMHADTNTRDSLACDLMEPIRPQVDAYVLQWLMREPLRREWFFEQRNGSCRLMPSICERLSDTASTWARAVAPIAERVATALWSATKMPTRPATPLTQRHRREAKGVSVLATQAPRRPPRVCRGCGTTLRFGSVQCAACDAPAAVERMVAVAKEGRVAAQAPKAQARRAATRRRQARAARAWNPSDQPSGLTAKVYVEQIQPRLASITIQTLASALGVSLPYAACIRAGRRRPHPRHWLTLARLAGMTPCPQA